MATPPPTVARKPKVPTTRIDAFRRITKILLELPTDADRMSVLDSIKMLSGSPS